MLKEAATTPMEMECMSVYHRDRDSKDNETRQPTTTRAKLNLAQPAASKITPMRTFREEWCKEND